MKNLGYYNGEYGEIEDIKIPMNDRVCYFGDGVYDATYSRNYKIFALDEHINRIYNSASLLDIKIDISKEEMSGILNEMVKKMDTGNNFVYWQVTRGTAPRNHPFPKNAKPNLWINIFPKELFDTSKKVSVITSEDTRYFHCNIKTLNLIPNVMAAEKARAAGAFETVFHRNGRVTECSHSNVHIIKDGVFKTAPTDNLILPGITRRHIIDICKRNNIPVSENPFSLGELFDADEIIITSSSVFGASVNMADGKEVGGKAPELAELLKKELMDEFVKETNQ